MKVLHVIPAVAPCYGGPSEALIHMCRAQMAIGVAPVIATTDANGTSRLPVELFQSTEYKGVQTVFFPREHSESFKYSAQLKEWLGQNISAFDIVHIHAVFSHSSLAAASACRKRHVPYVVRPLGSLDPWSLGQRRILKRILWYCGVEQMLSRAAAIHYTSAEEMRLAEIALGSGSRGVVIPLGVDPALLETLPLPQGVGEVFSESSDPYILILSRMVRKKRIHDFLEAFVDIIRMQRFSRWVLVLAGRGDPKYMDLLKSLVKQAQVEGSVRFLDWLEGYKKIAALRGAALLALPSYQENFGIAAVEAMACGVPVLVSERVNLATEIANAKAGWITPLSEEGLRSTLREALESIDERRIRGERGRNLVLDRFQWNRCATSLSTLYASIHQRSEACI